MMTRKRRRTRSSLVPDESESKRQHLEESENEATAPSAETEQAIENHEPQLPQPEPELQPEPAPVTNGDGQVHAEVDNENENQIEVEVENVDEPEAESRPTTNDAIAENAVINELAVSAAAVVEAAAHGQNGSLMNGAHPQYLMDDWTNPAMHLCIQSMPILENLSVQILQTLAKNSYQETLTIVTEPDSAPGQAYATLKAIFDQTKKVYSRDEPFLSANDLNLRDPEHRNTIRKANLATFVSSVFGSQDVGFYHLNEYFLETFVPDGGRLLKQQGALFLDLKTQAYLSAMANGERSREEILEDLFPDDLGDRLLCRRPMAKQLTPSEIDFVKRARSRCDHLLNQPDDEESMAALPEKYVWEDFLREVSAYVNRNFDELVSGSGPKTSKIRPATSGYIDYMSQHAHQHQPEVHHQHMQPEDYHLHEALQGYSHHQEQRPSYHQHHRDVHQDARQHDVVQKAARAAQVALQTDLLAGNHHAMEQQLRTPPQPQQQPDQSSPDALAMAQSLGGVPDIPYHTQSAPTQVLYERARLAATAKASPNNRRAGLPSQRRPWTTEEENALMAGLDRVKGPHWSQILAMFGAGGTINESLKDRNQVQLKDKARNLKLFFLKSGIEVPYYLQFVTGELKTRAPTQAAKNEAKERAKVQSEQDMAHFEGVLAKAQEAVGELGEAQEGEEAGDEMENCEGESSGIEQQIVEQLQAVQQPEPELEPEPEREPVPEPIASPEEPDIKSPPAPAPPSGSRARASVALQTPEPPRTRRSTRASAAGMT